VIQPISAPSSSSASTQDSPLVCDDIVHPALLSVPFENFEEGQETVENWTITNFPTTTVAHRDSAVYGWSSGEQDFILSLGPSSGSIVQTSKKQPTIGAILSCYGDPDFYTLEETALSAHAYGVRFTMWYLERGLIFRTESYGTNETRRFDAASLMGDRITVVPPGTAEEMIRNGVAQIDEYVNRWLGLLQEWPGDFTELVLEE
jgi:hypothetical protein